jgi:hypothetical protein
MNKHLQRFFLFETCKIQTKLPKREILKRIRDIPYFEPDYKVSTSENGFFVAEKPIKRNSHNSFVPIAKATITEAEGISTVSVLFRMNLLVIVLFAPFYFLSLLTIVVFPVLHLLIYISFLKPAKKLKNYLTEILTNDGAYDQVV